MFENASREDSRLARHWNGQWIKLFKLLCRWVSISCFDSFIKVIMAYPTSKKWLAIIFTIIKVEIMNVVTPMSRVELVN